MSLVSQHLEAQRANITFDIEEEFNDQGPRNDVWGEDSDAASDLPFPEEEMPVYPGTVSGSTLTRDECQSCGRETYRHCEHCNRGWFCSQGCQDRMSLDHLAKCSARPITAADILFDDVLKDQIPNDEETCEAFGFSRCGHAREKSHLLGVYQGLFLYIQDPEISPVNLHKWQKKGMLVTKIIEKFSAVPENSRGGYFPWFLRNQHVLDNTKAVRRLQGEDNPILRAIAAARPCLELEDCDKDPLEFEPIGKRDYAITLDSSTPNPNWVELDLWYDFGFAVCADEHNERGLGALYTRLFGGTKSSREYDKSLGISPRSQSSLPTCSFDEFWRAWENGTMGSLFDKYGIDTRLGQLNGVPHLRHFMSFPVEKHGFRPSVWRLKHLLALNDNTPIQSFPKVKEAAEEYGLTSQLDTKTRMALRQFYGELIKAGDPLEVHRAKESGKLLEYAQSSLGVTDQKLRDVLRKLDLQSK
ncbi:hypothetical protein N7513_002760 [Penicillium frequentans]|nr:hypothetical protein N7513_002760 [Penicillium glabrum]